MSTFRPYLIDDQESNGRVLDQLPVDNTDFQESWLQELLQKHPGILPIKEFAPRFGPLVPVGREIGNIDNLFINPEGLITIVETKLWRNPEAHRKVVSQILDYAKMLSSWDYGKLDDAVKKYTAANASSSQSLYQLVMSSSKLDISEAEFIEKVQTCLENGEFALLVVGDIISPKATELADMIQSAPHMHFTMGFVELNCHRLNSGKDWPLVVVPKLITKTNEVTRAIVKIYYEGKQPDAVVETFNESSVSIGSTSQKEFLSSLPSEYSGIFESYLDDWGKAGYTIFWGTVGFSLRIIWNGKLTTILDAYPKYLSIFQEKRIHMDKLTFDEFHSYHSELIDRSQTIARYFTDGKRYIKYIDISEDDLRLLLECTDKLTRAWAQRAISE